MYAYLLFLENVLRLFTDTHEKVNDLPHEHTLKLGNKLRMMNVFVWILVSNNLPSNHRY